MKKLVQAHSSRSLGGALYHHHRCARDGLTSASTSSTPLSNRARTDANILRARPRSIACSCAGNDSQTPFGRRNEESKVDAVRVRFKIQYRAHSRQTIAVAGSMSPLGWSFLSIARNPLVWNEGDWWTIELEFPRGANVQYKYVILEDQDWTRQCDEFEGLVPVYRPEGLVAGTGKDKGEAIRKMAIVAWQPGPNLELQLEAKGKTNNQIITKKGAADGDGDLIELVDLWNV